MLVVLSLHLPAALFAQAPDGQSAPAPSARQAPRAGSWASVWSQELPGTDDTLLALSDAFVFLAGPDTPISARTLASGALVWEHSASSWQALTASSTLVIGVSGDHAYALDAATGRTRWVTTTTGTNTRLIVDATHLLMASDSDLLLRDLQAGTPLWRVGLTAPPTAPVVMSGDTILAATTDGLLTAMERTTGAPRWQVKVSGAARMLAVGPTAAYVGLGTGTLCSYAIETGGERWCFPLRIPFSGAPIIDGDRVRVVLLDNSLRTFDRQSGSMQQPLSLGHRPAAGPWVTPSGIIVALTTGECVVIDRQSNRVLARLSVPGSSTSHLLERAAIGTDGRSMASVTVATSGERRLSVYQPVTSPALPVLTPAPALPFPSVPLHLP